ncbi:SDR family NAD(P)-dependent oxidoreductase [Roseospira visakhapatnamensis]|uniref:Short-subunit dehydrogenase n=1 Tax=Roseospira visakhapatnamensis TaxID=390880 RepID=A0A7W6RDE0_9PROT|nr:SDR family oxidoreductase [Roseospira visakhapatnamensis]MBB4266514.1 short-subunit dehydrogenase [Roseospira visakhapatnamensis]
MSRHVAVVTGASRGIGREVARHFASRGYDLVLVARDESRLAAAAETLRADHGIAVESVAVDVCALADAARAVLDAVDRGGRLDVLVNAAGIFRFGTSVASVDDLDAMLRTNVLAIHNLCAACLDHLRQAEDGRIFNISSIAGVEPFAPVGGYAASKHALVGYGRSLAREQLPNGVKVTTLCPDVVDTDMGAGSGLPPEDMIAPADISRAIDFVMSLSPAAVVEHLTIGCKPATEGPRAQG